MLNSDSNDFFQIVYGDGDGDAADSPDGHCRKRGLSEVK